MQLDWPWVLAIAIVAFLLGRISKRPPETDLVAIPAPALGRDLRPDASVDEQIRRHLAAGQKIQAIKLYREVTGVGLAEAKTAVERMQAGGPPPKSI
ncbi:MAG: hypothetical protein HOV79_13145 [Hamadaea sp.]|nr:hypothetical protein [Hamadaea sp.]